MYFSIVSFLDERKEAYESTVLSGCVYACLCV
jgi:hypothetical protein